MTIWVSVLLSIIGSTLATAATYDSLDEAKVELRRAISAVLSESGNPFLSPATDMASGAFILADLFYSILQGFYLQECSNSYTRLNYTEALKVTLRHLDSVSENLSELIKAKRCDLEQPGG